MFSITGSSATVKFFSILPFFWQLEITKNINVGTRIRAAQIAKETVLCLFVSECLTNILGFF